jgi:hypothetical protein
VDDKDRAWLHGSLKKVTKEHFKEDFDALFKHLGTSKNVSNLIIRLTLFCLDVSFSSDAQLNYHKMYRSGAGCIKGVYLKR